MLKSELMTSVVEAGYETKKNERNIMQTLTGKLFVGWAQKISEVEMVQKTVFMFKNVQCVRLYSAFLS